MIRAVFERRKDMLAGFQISGHAGFGEEGEDIVCASVTSAAQLIANGITEILNAPARVAVEENLLSLTLPEEADACAAGYLESLLLHLRVLEEAYPENIAVSVTT